MIVGKTLAEWIECYQDIINEPDQIQRVKDYYNAKIQGLVDHCQSHIGSYAKIGYQDGLIDRELMQGS